MYSIIKCKSQGKALELGGKIYSQPSRRNELEKSAANIIIWESRCVKKKEFVLL